MADPNQEDEILVVDEAPSVQSAPEDESSEEPKNNGEVDSSEDEEEEQRKKKRKRGGNPQAKIKELWQREQDNIARIRQLEQEKEQEKQITNQKMGKYQEIAVTNAEANLNAQKKYLEQELRIAHETGDAAKIAKITSDISQVQADESQLKRYKTESYINGEQQTKPAHQPQYVQQPIPNDFDSLYESGSMATKKWLDESRDWFDPESGDYDEEKASDITFYARNLERKLTAEGRSAEIGTSGYYREIRKYTEDNYSESNEDDSSHKKTFNRSSGGAAPVNNRSQNTQAKKPVTISLAEKNMALSLNLRHPNGVDYSDAEKIRAYVAGKKQ